jgi:hypothetical protein
MKVGKHMHTETIGDLLNKVNALQDTGARNTALTLLLATLEFHRAALERLMEIVVNGGDRTALASDPLVSSLLLYHDLHPFDLETRVASALNRPEIRTCPGKAELISIRNGIVRVRIEGGPELSSAVEGAIAEAAPDIAWLQIECDHAAITRLTNALIN